MNQGPHDDQPETRPPESGLPSMGARRPSWHAMLSLLAGSGLTAAGLGALAPGALGAEGTTGPTTTGTTETTNVPPPPPTTTPTTSEPVKEAPRESSTTSTTTSTQPAKSPTATGQSPTSEGPAVVIRHKQRTTPSKPASSNATTTKAKSPSGQSSRGGKAAKPGAGAVPGAPNNVALAPQLIAGQAGALSAMLAGSAASAQALDFYRIPLFLLPIYRAAAIHYDVPWPILAAINEIETNYGADLSVSSAGAEGWMQFEPSTWLQYGVDALNAGYADPYNPVDAIFAAARYLHAAGASTDLHAAILAYNHSEAYVDSVLLRAKLIAAYPDQVIATLTGLIDGRPPITGKRIGWSTVATSSDTAPAKTGLPPSSSATAGATPTQASAGVLPGSAAAPSPTAAAAGEPGVSPRWADITSEPHAKAVAVQDGRVVKLGSSRKLGRYVILQDVYGDVFTYAHLGSIAPTYTPPASESVTGLPAPAAQNAPTHGASAPPRAPASNASTLTGGKVRVFARTYRNPDALAARAGASTNSRAATALPLRSGSVVSEGTVLGQVVVPPGAHDGHLRFAIRPTGDTSTIDPRAILANWTQLDTALHPRGAKGGDHSHLLGATASDVFLLPKSRLEHEVLADPGIGLSACSRHEVASGAIDKRALAVLAFLSRSGLKPSVGTLPCGAGAFASAGLVTAGHSGDALAIVAINGIPIAGHQGAGSIADTTIRTLLTLHGEYVPARIVSLMRYPRAPTTSARADHGDYIEIVFTPAAPHTGGSSTVAGVTARSASAGAGAGVPAAPVAVVGELTPAQWEQLIARIAGLPEPTVAVKPSSAAIPDSQSSAGASQAVSGGVRQGSSGG